MKKINYLSILLLVFTTLISCSDETTILSAIEDGKELEEGAQVSFLLNQNYPNPFNPTTVITFTVSHTMRLTLNVYTEDWVKVATVVNRTHYAGYYQVTFDSKNSDGDSLPSGEYYYTLEGEGLIITRKMMLLK